MEKTLLSEIEDFMTLTGLSEHRTGIVLADNGKLVERLRSGGRVWPETEQKIRESLNRETARRQKDAA